MWKTLKIGDVCDLMTGGTPDRKKPEYFSNGHIKWLVSGDINQREIFDCSGRITEAGLKNSNAKFLPEDSVLIALNGQGKTRGTVALLRTKATCNQSLVAIHPKQDCELDTKFLFYVLDGMYDRIRRITGDAGNDRRGLNMPLIRNIYIPYPPIAEQQRIVAKLDDAFAEIDNIATITEKELGEVRKLYGSSITEIYFSDKSVPVLALSKISKIKGGKRLPKGKKLQLEPTNYPYIRVSDFTDFGTIDEKSIQYITEEIRSEISRYTISSEDVYVSIAGTIGKTGIIPQSLDGANLTENAAKIVLSEECDKNYLYFFTTSSSFEKQAIAQTRTAAQPKLALERLGAVELPLHNKLTQQAIAGRAGSLRDKVRLVETLLNEKLLKIQALKSAILLQELQREAA